MRASRQPPETMQSHETKMDLSLPLQGVYLLLFATSCVGALWQKGDPTLTLAILAAILPLGLLARLPRRWFPGWLRQLLQAMIGACGLVWWNRRMSHVPVDIALVEAAAILGTALILGGVLKEYGLLGTMCLILMGFGGLSPGRPAFLPAFALFGVIATLLLYLTRTLRLTRGDPDHARPDLPRGAGNWAYCLAHLVMVISFFLLLITSFPMPSGEASPGVVPVSFHTEQGLEFPQLWKHWIRPTQNLITNKEAKQSTDQAEDPTSIEDDARASAQTTKPNQFDAREGDGGNGIGTDLLFRVHSPAKLYWLAQLYDVYTGDRWLRSPSLAQRLSDLDKLKPVQTMTVKQNIIVEKAVSRRLPAAFELERIAWGAGTADVSERMPAMLRYHVAGAEWRADPPPLPWRYQAQSLVPTVDSKVPLPADEDFQHKGWNYRRLPDKLISPRLRQLAADLTAGYDTPLKKAIALRDFLRENYAYSLTPPPIPKERELVDMFLFETREGYCQHFAQALTVLARLAGLQARLASGYSPGNYNLLGNYFEVYEYHAHVWSQIFIPPYGWLTFDGVAPANLQLETTPSFLQNFLDPFGDEWAAHPPELSLQATPPKQTARESQQQARIPEEERNKIVRVAEDVYAKAVMDSGSMEPQAGDIAAAALKTFSDWLGDTWARTKTALSAWIDHAWRMLRRGISRLQAFLASRSLADYVGAAVVAGALAWLWRRRARLLAWCRRRYAILACERLWKELQQSAHDAPVGVVRRCLLLSDRLRALGHCPRPPNSDLVEYAAWLRQHDPELAPPVSRLSVVAAAALFGPLPPSPADARAALEATGELRTLLLPRVAGHCPSRHRHLAPGANTQHTPGQTKTP